MSALFQDIKGRQQDFMRAFNAGDANGAAQVYDPDGHFMPNGRNPVKGRAGLLPRRHGRRRPERPEEVNGSGDWAYERGSYHLDGSKGQETGAYLLVWKKVNGVWLIHNDCFNVIKKASA